MEGSATSISPARPGPAPFTAADPLGESLGVSAGAILAGIVHCASCRRAPLVGEWATLHRNGSREAWLCDLCEGDDRRASAYGEPLRRERFRSVAGAINVRRVS
jgi:hypothetical protein